MLGAAAGRAWTAYFAAVDPPPASWRPPLPWWAWLVLIASTVAVYANSLPNGFHYDDGSMIVTNPAVHGLYRLPSHFVSVTAGNQEEQPSYRPLVMATYVLNYAWGQTDPTGYHVVTIGLHLAAAFLVILLVWNLTGRRLAALFGGLLFALHPIQTEAVNYITARSSVLYTAAALAAVVLFIRYRQSRRPGMLAAASLAYAAALLSKEAAVVVPVLLVGYDVIVRRCGRQDVVRWLRPHAVFALLTLAFLGLRRTLLGAATLPAAHGDPLVAMMTFAAIVKKTLVGQLAPVNLSVSHAFGPIRVVNADALLACGLLAALLVASAALRRRAPLAAFAAWWFPVGLLPLAALPFITPLALYQENRGYLSAVALAMIAGPIMAWWWGEAEERAAGEGVPAERSEPVVVSGALWLRRGLLVGVFAVMAVAVIQRNPVWRDDLTLWTDVLNKAPGNQAAYINVGGAHQARGDLDAAAEVYQRALERFPNNGMLHNNLGVIYRSRGDLDRATKAFQAAIRTTPGFAMPYFNLGLILQGAGYRREAIIAYERFLELAPGQQGTVPHIPKARERLNALRGESERVPGNAPGTN